jgi:glycosyltransferase involved in cell wall biosynthesis
MPPLISVIIPAYNTEELIASTLASVVAQDYGNMEIIVVNDASTDGTGDAARRVLENCGRSYKVMEHEVNRGECGSRNTGIGVANGEYVVFVDADDLVDVNYLSILYKTVSSSENCDMAFCGHRSLEALNDKETAYPIQIDWDYNYSAEDFAVMKINTKISIVVGSVIYRKKFIDNLGLQFKEGCICGGDTEFLLKALAMSEATAVSRECPYIYRLHGNMGSRAGHTTLEQNVRRYTDLIQAHIRAGHYIVEHSKSPSVVRVAKYMLLPKHYLKMFTMHAWRNDREAFFADLRSKNIKNILMSSWKIFPRSLDITLKSLWLLMFPGMYYEYRRRHVYYYKI